MYITDLHIHSRYSRATSKECVPELLELWACRKGIGLLGTGDFTHPAWRKELREKLEPAEDGLYRLKREYRRAEDFPLGPGDRPKERPRFAVTGEISSIYKKNGRVRKVHNVIVLPSLDAADALAARLEAIGNIHSDGRPILGLDCRDLLEITLDTSDEAIFIPAHIWTPHFSLFGAFSGFDTIEECFEDLTPYIHALETGLSSDPPMNWRLSALDRYHLVSTSDAHSPAKLGREATLIDGELSYGGLARAMELGAAGGLAGTIEFFPEEGKYHLDGHRGCGLCLTPEETAGYGGKCPVCGKKITIGVLHRVEQLADRPEGCRREGGLPFERLAPLVEVIAASEGIAAGGAKAQARYLEALRRLGPEFYILREAPLEDIGKACGPCTAEGIRRLRAGQVKRRPGYDGEYGAIRLLEKEEIDRLEGQDSLFGAPPRPEARKRLSPKPAGRPPEKPEKAELAAEFSGPEIPPPAENLLAGLNEEQRQAVTSEARTLAVIAGPGTGKTSTLVSRVVYLIEKLGVPPKRIAAVTFTNKAAAEMSGRLKARLSRARDVRALTIGTFHSICLGILKETRESVNLVSESDALEIAGQIIGDLGLNLSPKKFLRELSRLKNSGAGADGLASELLPAEASRRYALALRELGCLDFDDLLLETLALYESSPGEGMAFPVNDNAKSYVPPGFSHLLVDELQDSSPLQRRLVRVWSEKSEGLFVIGDPDQSIYGFRGAEADCFELLLAERPEASVIRLTRNYRSAPEILSRALPVINLNPGGPRQLTPCLAAGGLVRLVESDSDLSEAIFIAKEINRLVGGVDMLDAQSLDRGRERQQARSFSDIAVLCRTHRQAELVEKCLRHDSIPCIVTGREDFLEDPLVRGVVSFFRCLLEPADELSRQVCLRNLFGLPGLPERNAAKPHSAAGAVNARPLDLFSELTEKYRSLLAKEKPRRLLEGLRKDLGLENSVPLDRLLNMAVFHPSMAAFSRALLLGQEQDLARSSSGKAYASGAVNLLTLHGAKGLEFPVVFVAGLKKGVIPLESPGRQADLAEERRLFYVGLTRAREELILLASETEPSPFLSVITEKGLIRQAAPKRPQPGAKQLSLF